MKEKPIDLLIVSGNHDFLLKNLWVLSQHAAKKKLIIVIPQDEINCGSHLSEIIKRTYLYYSYLNQQFTDPESICAIEILEGYTTRLIKRIHNYPLTTFVITPNNLIYTSTKDTEVYIDTSDTHLEFIEQLQSENIEIDKDILEKAHLCNQDLNFFSLGEAQNSLLSCAQIWSDIDSSHWYASWLSEPGAHYRFVQALQLWRGDHINTLPQEVVEQAAIRARNTPEDWSAHLVLLLFYPTYTIQDKLIEKPNTFADIMKYYAKKNHNAYRTVCFEICGVCNAKCPYCVTGKKIIIDRNLEDIKARKLVNVAEFEDAIDHMLTQGVISPSESILYLFNWGEPLLHPKLEELLSILTVRNLKYAISTNCSVFKELSSDVLKNLVYVNFSMPGFSQKSYDRIHGFKFEKVVSNIANMVHVWRAAGCQARFKLGFHVYQFNIFELDAAFDFANQLEIDFEPVYATLNGYKLTESYLDKTMTYEQMQRCTSELFTFFYDEIKRPDDYVCEQFDQLAINEYCELLPCCGVERGMPLYSFGKITTMSSEQMYSTKRNAEYCTVCAAKGLDYFGTAVLNKKVGRV